MTHQKLKKFMTAPTSLNTSTTKNFQRSSEILSSRCLHTTCSTGHHSSKLRSIHGYKDQPQPKTKSSRQCKDSRTSLSKKRLSSKAPNGGWRMTKLEVGHFPRASKTMLCSALGLTIKRLCSKASGSWVASTSTVTHAISFVATTAERRPRFKLPTSSWLTRRRWESRGKTRTSQMLPQSGGRTAKWVTPFLPLGLVASLISPLPISRKMRMEVEAQIVARLEPITLM